MEMNFKRGDTAMHYFKIPKEIYRAGSTLYFMAKPDFDNDFEDSKAEINKSFGDGAVALDETTATYTLKFTPEDTAGIVFDGENVKQLKGEFEYRLPNGDVYSYPNNKSFIKVKVFADLRRGGR